MINITTAQGELLAVNPENVSDRSAVILEARHEQSIVYRYRLKFISPEGAEQQVWLSKSGLAELTAQAVKKLAEY